MCTLALTLFLSHFPRRKCYRITLEKLWPHLGITTTHKTLTIKRIQAACKEIPWADMRMEDGMCVFSLRPRKATPIYTLRKVLDEAVEQGL